MGTKGKSHRTGAAGGDTLEEIAQDPAAQHTGHPFFMITRGLFRPGFLEALIVLPRLAMSFLIKEYLFKKRSVQQPHL